MTKPISFKLSFKIFQWVLVGIIIFSTFLGYQFYQINYQSQLIENQRFWIVSKLNQYRLHSENLSFFARQYLINLDGAHFKKYDNLINKKNYLVDEVDSSVNSTENRKELKHYEVFKASEKLLLKKVSLANYRLRVLEKKAFQQMIEQLTSGATDQGMLDSGLQSQEYLRLSLDNIASINSVRELVNKRFQDKVGKMEVRRARLTYLIPLMLLVNLFLILVSFLYIGKRMKKYHADLKGLTLKDFLTGVHNRKYLMETGPMLLSLNRREHSQVAVLLLDIDNFKMVNDRYGHDIGDEVLKAFCQGITNRIRKEDIFARIGGEEFVLMLNKVTPRDAQAFANKLRKILAKQCLMNNKYEIKYTVSIGMIMSDEFSELKKLINNADKALYTAKNSGRDQVVMYNKEYLAPSYSV
jgi:diguanylate cyclase (GGDEF)-like protein